MINKDFIIKFFFNGNELIKQRCLKKYLIKHGIYNDLLNYYSDASSINEIIYRIKNDINIRPTCKICGNSVRYANGFFSTYCCPTCRNSDPEVILKNKLGVSKSLKHVYKERGDEIKRKRNQTLKEKFGEDSSSPFGIKAIQNKIKEKNLEKYGVENVFSLSKNRLTRKYWQQRSIALQKTYGYDIEYITDESGETKILVKNGCKEHGNIIVSLLTFNNRTKPERREDATLCTICNPLKSHETGIESIIKNMLKDLNVNFIQYDRQQIHPFELDFYLPNYNIGIECNGVFWHAGEENGKKLANKYKLCQNKNITLISLWEHEIHNKKKIIYSYLQQLLNKSQNKILSRNCKIKEISLDDANKFINENSLLDNKETDIQLGLFNDDELISIMTFIKNSNENYELCVLGSKNSINIINGYQKLFNYFKEKYKPKEIICYMLNDISYKNIYENLGFKFEKYCDQTFKYIDAASMQVITDLKSYSKIYQCFNGGYSKYVYNF